MSDQHLLAEITQSAVIFYNGKILVLELTNFPWKRVFPGGRINQWEYWLEGLKRELKEEIGIEKFEVNNVISIDNWDFKYPEAYNPFAKGDSEERVFMWEFFEEVLPKYLEEWIDDAEYEFTQRINSHLD